jgi:FixJ family two-component response regulator
MKDQNPNPSEKKKVVLVDDDILVRMTWKMAAKSKNIPLSCYENPDQLKKDLHQFDRSTLIYIDSNLGNGLKGEEFAKELFQLGYHELFLATGYPEEEFRAVKSIIRSVVGKNPPWIDSD